jgi:hypothetical protein
VERLPVDELPAPVPVRQPLIIGQKRHASAYDGRNTSIHCRVQNVDRLVPRVEPVPKNCAAAFTNSLISIASAVLILVCSSD